MDLNAMEDFHFYFRTQVITRLDSLMYGILGAYLMYYYRNFWLRYKRVFFILGLLVLFGMKVGEINGLFPIRRLFYCVFSFSLFSFGVLLLLPFLSDLKKGKGMVFQWFTFISLISYSMYLINNTVVKYHIIKKIPWDSFLNPLAASYIQYILFWMITIIISSLIYRYFEIPMMNLRDRKKIKNRFPTVKK